jgi:hypothetical protein
VLDAVAELDLAAFYAGYRRDGWGAAAHDPEMMVALLVYAYAIGERSSRAIERRCREGVAFRVITANQVPDHTTIARFRVRHEAGLGDLFGQILSLCADAGLVSVAPGASYSSWRERSAARTRRRRHGLTSSSCLSASRASCSRCLQVLRELCAWSSCVRSCATVPRSSSSSKRSSSRSSTPQSHA